jgi:hypothetical protein
MQACGCKRNGQSLGHCLTAAASLAARLVRSAVQTGPARGSHSFRTATCQNGWLPGGRPPPAGGSRSSSTARRGLAWLLAGSSSLKPMIHLAPAGRALTVHAGAVGLLWRRRTVLGEELFVGAVVALPVALLRLNAPVGFSR